MPDSLKPPLHPPPSGGGWTANQKLEPPLPGHPNAQSNHASGPETSPDNETEQVICVLRGAMSMLNTEAEALRQESIKLLGDDDPQAASEAARLQQYEANMLAKAEEIARAMADPKRAKRTKIASGTTVSALIATGEQEIMVAERVHKEALERKEEEATGGHHGASKDSVKLTVKLKSKSTAGAAAGSHNGTSAHASQTTTSASHTGLHHAWDVTVSHVKSGWHCIQSGFVSVGHTIGNVWHSTVNAVVSVTQSVAHWGPIAMGMRLGGQVLHGIAHPVDAFHKLTGMVAGLFGRHENPPLLSSSPASIQVNPQIASHVMASMHKTASISVGLDLSDGEWLTPPLTPGMFGYANHLVLS